MNKPGSIIMCMHKAAMMVVNVMVSTLRDQLDVDMHWHHANICLWQSGSKNVNIEQITVKAQQRWSDTSTMLQSVTGTLVAYRADQNTTAICDCVYIVCFTQNPVGTALRHHLLLTGQQTCVFNASEIQCSKSHSHLHNHPQTKFTCSASTSKLSST